MSKYDKDNCDSKFFFKVDFLQTLQISGYTITCVKTYGMIGVTSMLEFLALVGLLPLPKWMNFKVGFRLSRQGWSIKLNFKLKFCFQIHYFSKHFLLFNQHVNKLSC